MQESAVADHARGIEFPQRVLVHLLYLLAGHGQDPYGVGEGTDCDYVPEGDGALRNAASNAASVDDGDVGIIDESELGSVGV